MQKLLNQQGNIVDNSAVIVEKTDANAPNSTNDILPLEQWLALKSEQSDLQNGVWMDSDESPQALEPFIEEISLIAIHFPKFIDGRGYSYAHILRNHMGYTGDLRAFGDVLPDQMFFYQRCGFSSYLLREDVKAEQAKASLSDFSITYQAAVDDKEPLFRRHALS